MIMSYDPLSTANGDLQWSLERNLSKTFSEQSSGLISIVGVGRGEEDEGFKAAFYLKTFAS